MKATREGGKVGISNWNLDAFDSPPDFRKWIQAAVDEAVDLAIQDPCEVGLGAKNPDQIIVWLPLGEFSNDYGGPEFRFSLSGLIREEIDLIDQADPENLAAMAVVRDNLRRLADEIDAALAVNRSV